MIYPDNEDDNLELLTGSHLCTMGSSGVGALMSTVNRKIQIRKSAHNGTHTTATLVTQLHILQPRQQDCRPPQHS